MRQPTYLLVLGLVIGMIVSLNVLRDPFDVNMVYPGLVKKTIGVSQDSTTQDDFAYLAGHVANSGYRDNIVVGLALAAGTPQEMQAARGLLDASEIGAATPRARLALVILGRRYFAQGLRLEASDMLKRASVPGYLVGWAKQLRRAGAYQDALEILSWALPAAPDSGEAWATLGLTLSDLQDWPAARDALSKAVAHGTGGVEVNRKLSRAFLETGDAALALAAAQSAVPLLPSLNPQNPYEIAEVYALVGTSLRRMQQPEQAIPWFEKAAALIPQEPYPILMAAAAYHEAGVPDRCWETYRELVARFPDRFSLNSSPCGQ